MSTFYIKTFGCKVNQYDSQKLAEYLYSRGYCCDNLSRASNIIVNSCSVTARSEQKIRQFIRKHKNTFCRFILTGCYAQRLMLTGQDISGNVTLVSKDNKNHWEKLFPIRPENIKQSLYPPSCKTRAFIKIQDGCRQYCSYCIIPFLRGPDKSRSPREILSELESVYARGVREVVLTGIHIGRYGQDLPEKYSLSSLCRIIQKQFSFDRIRLSSIEYNEVTPDLIELLQEPPFCRHLHIPLQSGSNRILKAMNRSYCREDFIELLLRLRDEIPLMGISTDIIAGFPEETSKDFDRTRQILHTFPFVRVHVFPYSKRPLTAAASFNNALEQNEIKQRAALLRKDTLNSTFRFYTSMREKTLPMLTESCSHNINIIKGYSDNYLNLQVNTDIPVRPNTLINVRGQYVQQNSQETLLLSQWTECNKVGAAYRLKETKNNPAVL